MSNASGTSPDTCPNLWSKTARELAQISGIAGIRVTASDGGTKTKNDHIAALLVHYSKVPAEQANRVAKYLSDVVKKTKPEMADIARELGLDVNGGKGEICCRIAAYLGEGNAYPGEADESTHQPSQTQTTGQQATGEPQHAPAGAQTRESSAQSVVPPPSSSQAQASNDPQDPGSGSSRRKPTDQEAFQMISDDEYEETATESAQSFMPDAMPSESVPRTPSPRTPSPATFAKPSQSCPEYGHPRTQSQGQIFGMPADDALKRLIDSTWFTINQFPDIFGTIHNSRLHALETQLQAANREIAAIRRERDALVARADETSRQFDGLKAQVISLEKVVKGGVGKSSKDKV